MRYRTRSRAYLVRRRLKSSFWPALDLECAALRMQPRCWGSLCSNEGLHVWPDHVLNPANLGSAPEFVHRRFFLFVGGTKCFYCSFHTDFGPKFKAVRNGLGRAVNAERSSVYRMRFNTKLKGILGEVNDSEGWEIDLGRPSITFDRQPDFEGIFWREFMVAEGRRQAEDAGRNPLGNFEQGFVGGDRGVLSPVEPAADTFDLACFGEIPEV